jgi:hypothetical protein
MVPTIPTHERVQITAHAQLGSDDASNVAGRAANSVQACVDLAKSAASTADRADETANAAKNDSRIAVATVKTAGAVAAFFVIPLVGGFGWILNRSVEQIDTLKAQAQEARRAIARSSAEISAYSQSSSAEAVRRSALEVRLRDLEEELRVLQVRLHDGAHGGRGL